MFTDTLQSFVCILKMLFYAAQAAFCDTVGKFFQKCSHFRNLGHKAHKKAISLQFHYVMVALGNWLIFISCCLFIVINLLEWYYGRALRKTRSCAHSTGSVTAQSHRVSIKLRSCSVHDAIPVCGQPSYRCPT